MSSIHKNVGAIATCPRGHTTEVMPNETALGFWYCKHPGCLQSHHAKYWRVHRWPHVEYPKKPPKDTLDFESS